MNLKIRDGILMGNKVTNDCAKFDDNRLHIYKVLGNWKSDNKNKHKKKNMIHSTWRTNTQAYQDPSAAFQLFLLNTCSKKINNLCQTNLWNSYPSKTAAAKCPPLSIRTAQCIFTGNCSILQISSSLEHNSLPWNIRCIIHEICRQNVL